MQRGVALCCAACPRHAPDSAPPRLLSAPALTLSFLITPPLCSTGTRALLQIVPRFTPAEVQRSADERMGLVLSEAYAAARDMVRRNRPALDALVAALLERDFLEGEEVRAVVEAHGAKADLEFRAAEAAAFM